MRTADFKHLPIRRIIIMLANTLRNFTAQAEIPSGKLAEVTDDTDLRKLTRAFRAHPTQKVAAESTSMVI